MPIGDKFYNLVHIVMKVLTAKSIVLNVFFHFFLPLVGWIDRWIKLNEISLI